MKSINNGILKGYAKLQSVGINRQKGAVAVEYGLIIAIVVAVVITASGQMSGELGTFFKNAATQITGWMADQGTGTGGGAGGGTP